MRHAVGSAISLALLMSVTVAHGVEKMALSFSPPGSTVVVPATLIKPDGPGPFPAVVVLHDCSGLGPRASKVALDWAQWLAAQGYVTLLPDSFTPRGVGDGVCTLPPEQGRVANGNVRAGDAYGALLALRELPYVDGGHVGVMGGSHGGMTTLAAISMPKREDGPLAALRQAGFAAAVAIYPNCGLTYGAWMPERERPNAGSILSYNGVYVPAAPLLILVAEKDDWNPAAPCQRLVETSRAAGHPVSIKVYRGAHHLFDSDRPLRYDPQRTNLNAPSGHGATTAGDPAAWADARKDVAAFFARHLRLQ